MAHATAQPSTTEEALADHVTPAAVTAVQHPPVTPGKVAMWMFLATEIMFFTGLIGSYIVLRAGSPATAYSNLYSPARPSLTLGWTTQRGRHDHLDGMAPSPDQASRKSSTRRPGSPRNRRTRGSTRSLTP